MMQSRVFSPMVVLGVLTAVPLALVQAGAPGAAGKERQFEFTSFSEDAWQPARDPSVADPGTFVQRENYIENSVKEEHQGKHSLAAGYVMRVVKDLTFTDGRLEAEVELTGPSAPAIYFRTRVDAQGLHQEAYNLVVYNLDQPGKKDGRYGFNLWKWRSEWPAAAKVGKGHWVKLASWEFPVPLNQRFRMAVDCRGSYIKAFFNDELKGEMYDSEPFLSGQVGLCSCEGPNRFYSFRILPAGGP